MAQPIPPYVPAHGLLKGKSVAIEDLPFEIN